MAFGGLFHRGRSEEASVSFDSEGVSIVRPVDDLVGLGFLRWDEVARVLAYKKDCFGVDQIRLEFVSVAGVSLLVTEDDAGFGELIDSLPQYLAVSVDWYARLVAAPAFDGAVDTIFERSSGR
jgi:hypothetical protein